MGTTFSEFTRCLPASRVCTRCAWRRPSRCFMTPKRVKCGNSSTISVVVRGRGRRKSRIARRVGSESAFHTGSSSSAGRVTISVTPLLAVLFDLAEHVIPTGGHPLAVLGIDHADGAVPQCHLAACHGRLHFQLQVI